MELAQTYLRGGWHGQTRRGKRTRRDEIFEWICLYADDHNGNSPSILEVKRQFGLAYGTVHNHVQKLIVEGRIRQEDGKLIVIGSEWTPPPAIAIPR